MPASWDLIPELTDDFDDDTLDPAKWWDHNPHWLGRPPALFLPSNVTVKGACTGQTQAGRPSSR